MAIANILQAREDRKSTKELRKLKRQEMLNDYNAADVQIVQNKTFIDMNLICLGFSLIVGICFDALMGVGIALLVIVVSFIAIYIEAFIRSAFDVVSDFVNNTLSQDKDRRRSYRETKKVIDYAIKNDKLSDEQISTMIEGLIFNARYELQTQDRGHMNTHEIIDNQSIINTEVRQEEAQQVIDVTPIQESNTNKELKLVFNDAGVSIMNGSQEIDSVLYDEIIQPSTQEEIDLMPYSTMYGYVKKADKTIYIDMEKETALIK